MKIALILGNIELPKENYYQFIQEYLNFFKNKSWEIDLYCVEKELLPVFKRWEAFFIINYLENLKDLIKKKYDVIHNFGDKRFALLSAFICPEKVINTLAKCPVNTEREGIFPKTINISTTKEIFDENRFYFNSFININFSESKTELVKIVDQYQNLYLEIIEDTKVPFNQKLNIVFYAGGSVPFNGKTPFIKALGGSESSIVYVSKELAKAGHNVTVFSNCNSSKFFDGVFYDFPENYEKYNNEKNIDIFIVSRESSLINKSRAKVSIFWAHEDFNQIITVNFIENTLNGNLTDKIFVISNYQKANYIRYFKIPENKFYLTRNGINPSFYKNIKKRKRYKLMYTSTPYRGLDLLLKIFPQIKEIVPEAYLEIYSSIKICDYSEEFDNETYGELYRSLNKLEGVSIKELISQPELAEALSESYLLIYPNTYPETFCISAMEAQAAGTPVVTSAMGALTETIENGKTGICIPGDPYSPLYQTMFSGEVVKLLKDSEKWLEYSGQSRKRAQEKFSWKIIAGEWLEIFNFLVKEYDILENFFDFIQKYKNDFGLSIEGKTDIYQLFCTMTENFEFSRLKNLQNDLLAFFSNKNV